MRVVAAARYVLPVLVLNAAVQAVLVLPDPTAGLDALFVLGALVSGICMLVAYGVVVATSLAPDAGSMTRMLRARGARFTAWTVGLLVVTAVGLMFLGGIPGYLVLAVSPFVPLASMAADGSPVSVNVRAIGRHPFGYAWRLALTALVALVLVLQAALTTFFVGGPAATAITTLLAGLAVWWLTRLWAKAM